MGKQEGNIEGLYCKNIAIKLNMNSSIKTWIMIETTICDSICHTHVYTQITKWFRDSEVNNILLWTICSQEDLVRGHDSSRSFITQ